MAETDPMTVNERRKYIHKPCMGLQEKFIFAEGKPRRTFAPAQPLLDRLLASELPDKSRLMELFEFRKATNPLLLREKIDQSIEKLLALPCLGHLEKVNFFKTKLNVIEPSVTLSFDLTCAPSILRNYY